LAGVVEGEEESLAEGCCAGVTADLKDYWRWIMVQKSEDAVVFLTIVAKDEDATGGEGESPYLVSYFWWEGGELKLLR
jgi:hypothetical protein